MNRIGTFFAVLTASLGVQASDLPIEARIESVMYGAHRPAGDIARNRYRHPVGTLIFLGLRDGMTVLEIWPGGGWYTDILAPVMRNHGQYFAASWDQDVEGQPDYRYQQHRELIEKFKANPDLFDQAGVIPFSPPISASLGETDSYDMILTFRNTHGWVSDGVAQQVFNEFARVLKPGGVLGVVQHRAAADTDPAASAETGYLPEAAVIALARSAGLYLDGRSEVNANPADDHDHPEGVWSLPPSLAVCSNVADETERAKCAEPYLAIGESDRMTLRFRKPLL